MALPDFLIIGAMKCGTSTLQAQLASQPGIFMCTPKEPNFFSDDETFAKGLSWYEGLFADAAAGDLKGEASTHYTKLPTYPEALTRLSKVLRNPKLIYLIRNPVDRAVSHFIHEWTMGHMPADIESAFDLHPELVDYGRYAYQTEPYLAAFGREAIFLSTLEEMTRAPQEFLNKAGEFLSLEQPPVWRSELAQMNPSTDRVRRLPLHGLLVANPVAASIRRVFVPQAVRARIRSARQMPKKPAISIERRRSLEGTFAEDHVALTEMFPDHPEIATAYPFLNR